MRTVKWPNRSSVSRLKTSKSMASSSSLRLSCNAKPVEGSQSDAGCGCRLAWYAPVTCGYMRYKRGCCIQGPSGPRIQRKCLLRPAMVAPCSESLQPHPCVPAAAPILARGCATHRDKPPRSSSDPSVIRCKLQTVGAHRSSLHLHLQARLRRRRGFRSTRPAHGHCLGVPARLHANRRRH